MNDEKAGQASTLNALMLGNFDETVKVKDFLRQADTGLGTYTGLDGEAIFEDGVAYRATAEGTVTVMQPEDGVAFGTVAAFDAGVPKHTLQHVDSLDALRQMLAPYVEENENAFYLLRATGEFSTMHVRSCFACQKPYPTLAQAAETLPAGIPLCQCAGQCHRRLLPPVCRGHQLAGVALPLPQRR